MTLACIIVPPAGEERGPAEAAAAAVGRVTPLPRDGAFARGAAGAARAPAAVAGNRAVPPTPVRPAAR